MSSVERLFPSSAARQVQVGRQRRGKRNKKKLESTRVHARLINHARPDRMCVTRWKWNRDVQNLALLFIYGHRISRWNYYNHNEVILLISVCYRLLVLKLFIGVGLDPCKIYKTKPGFELRTC